MKKILLITLIFLFGIIYFCKIHILDNNTQMVFSTNIEEVDTSLYVTQNSIDNFFADIEKEIDTEYIDKSLNQVQNNNILININTASKEGLMTLPSIGESIAQNIIEYRQENGDFKSIEEIKNVKRIGDKTYEKIKDYITVGG